MQTDFNDITFFIYFSFFNVVKKIKQSFFKKSIIPSLNLKKAVNEFKIATTTIK